MDVLALDQRAIVGLLGFFAASTVTLVVYIWKGGLKDLKEIKSALLEQRDREAKCREELGVRFVSLKLYNDEMTKIVDRQNKLREILPEEYVRRQEHELILGRINFLENLSNQLLHNKLMKER